MKRFLFLLPALFLTRAWGAQTATSFALSPDAVDHVTVYADHFESGPNGDTLIASGSVHAIILQRGAGQAVATPITITAGSLAADMVATKITAEHGVIVEADGHTIRGEKVTYDWKALAGRVETITLSENGMSFRAASVDVSPSLRLMRDVVFSACGLERPDYVMRADTVKLIGNRRVAARNVRVELFGHRVVTLPSFAYGSRRSRGGGKQALPVPRPGHSAVSGFTLAQKAQLGENVSVEVEATTRAGLRGAISYANEGRFTPYVEADWKQERSSRSRLPVLVSRIPEVGVRFGPHAEANINTGYYRENSTGVHSGRATITFDHTLLDHGEHTGLRLIAGGRVSTYSTGDSYKTARIEASVGREQPLYDTFEEAGVRLNALQGRTPFEWDQVPIQTELFAGRRIPLGPYRLEAGVRYDVGHHEVYAVEVAVAKILRCIEPEIRYNDRKRAIVFEIKMLGG